MEDTIIRGGDVRVLGVDLYSSTGDEPIDLKYVWTNISIFENIEKNYIEGQITISEGQDLLASMPIITNEKIVITFRTPSRTEPYTFVGQVVDIPNRHQLTQGEKVYILEFVSPEFVKNQKTQFSKAYNKTLISDMASDIYEQFIKDVSNKTLHLIPTVHTTSRVVPTMSPFKAINWLCNWAVSDKYRSGASYVFFEGKYGYYFGPVERLIDESQIKKPAAVYNRGIAQGDNDIIGGFYAIGDLNEAPLPRAGGNLGSRNYLNNVVGGMYASKAKTHDIVLRKITDSSYNYFTAYPDLTHLEASSKYAIYTGDTYLHNDVRLGRFSDSFVQTIPEHYLAYSGQPSSRTASTSLIRNSQFQQFFSNKLIIAVPGDSDRTIGEVVRLEIPSASPNLEGVTETTDKYLSGRYLITALRHSINRTLKEGKETHYMQMVVSKDSYKEPLPIQTKYHKWS